MDETILSLYDIVYFIFDKKAGVDFVSYDFVEDFIDVLISKNRQLGVDSENLLCDVSKSQLLKDGIGLFYDRGKGILLVGELAIGYYRDKVFSNQSKVDMLEQGWELLCQAKNM